MGVSVCVNYESTTHTISYDIYTQIYDDDDDEAHYSVV